MADNKIKIPWGLLITVGIVLMVAPAVVSWLFGQMMNISLVTSNSLSNLNVVVRNMLQPIIQLGISLLLIVAALGGLALGAKAILSAIKRASKKMDENT